MKRALLFLVLCISTSLAAQNGFYLSHGLNREFITVRDSDYSSNGNSYANNYTTEPYINSLYSLQNEIGWTKNHYFIALNLGVEIYNMKIKGNINQYYFSHGGNSNEYYNQHSIYEVDYLSRLAIANGGLQLGFRWMNKDGNVELLVGYSAQIDKTVSCKILRDNYTYSATWSSSYYNMAQQTYVASNGDTTIYQPASSFLHTDYKTRLGFNSGPQSNIRFHINERCFIDILFGWRRIWNSRFNFEKIMERYTACMGVRFGYTIGKQKPNVVKEKEEVENYNK